MHFIKKYIYILFFSFSILSKQGIADLLILNGTIITMDQNETVINNGAIAICKDKILEIGDTNFIKNKYATKKIIDAKKKIVLPGFINAHTHAAMTLLRGFADDLDLYDWLEEILPMEKKLTQNDIYWGTKLACIEMIRSGITTFVDMYFFPDEIAKAVDDIAMRAVLCLNACKSNYSKVKQFIKKCSNQDLITAGLFIHSPYRCKEDQIIAAKKLADDLQMPLFMHVAETKKEIQHMKKKHSTSSVEYLDSLGILNDKLVFIHVVHVTPSEINLIKKNNIKVIHCPTSNMKLASGIAPIETMFKENIVVGLGTDSAASNNSLDMVAEMKTANLLQRVSTMNPKALTAYQTLQMATINNAQIIGMDKLIGSLQKDKKADIILISSDKSHQIPVYNIFSQLVYASKACDVETAIINGKVIMENKKFVKNINEKNVACHINKIKRKIQKFSLKDEKII